MVQIVLLIAFVTVVGLFILLRMCLLVITVHGQSMSPTLEHGDRVLVLRRWLVGRPRKGQIVVVTGLNQQRMEGTPRLHSQDYYVKRVVACGGESFSTAVDSSAQREEERLLGEQKPSVMKSWHIPPNHIFVCGDNRSQSVDSRSWGPLPLHRVVGVMLMKLTSVADAKILTSPLFEERLPVGMPPPSFSARSVNGETYELSTYTGRSLLLLFIAPNRLVRSHLPAYLTMVRKLATEQNIATLFVCDADLEQAQALAQAFQIELPVLVTPQETHPFFREYHVIGTPAYCLIDAEGKVQSSGFLVSSDQAWRSLSEKAQDTREVLDTHSSTSRKP